MNLKTWSSTKGFGLVCVLAFGFSDGIVVTAQASAIPNSIRGNWYQYLGDHHYARIRFTKHTVSYRNYNEGRYHYESPVRSTAQKVKGGWIEIKDAGGHGDGTFYRVSKNGKYKQLQVAYGRQIERVTSFNYYRTRIHQQ